MIRSLQYVQDIRGDLIRKTYFDQGKIYIVDVGSHIFVWFGSKCISELKNGINIGDEFLMKQNDSLLKPISTMIDGAESEGFLSHFQSWNTTAKI
jgi:hypothetical protein